MITSPIFLIITILSIFIDIRITKLNSDRIGHFAANTELYLCHKLELNVKSFDFFYISKDSIVCNKYFLKLISRKLFLIPFYLIEPIDYLYTKIFKTFKVRILNNSEYHNVTDRDINRYLCKYPIQLSLTKLEIENGNKILKNLNINETDKVVCLLVRDSAYLNQFFSNVNWEYHNYRDCTIDNYKLTCQNLSKLGYKVFRMGRKVNNNLELINNNIYDYANSDYKSDFLDIFLGHRCEFCISTSSGWDALPYIYRKPIVYAPILPLSHFFSFDNRYLFITKIFYSKFHNRNLSLREVLKNKNILFSLNSSDYTKEGIVLIENTEEEIWDVVYEMYQRINHEYLIDEKDTKLKNSFWDLYKSEVSEKSKNLHSNLLLGNIGIKYLKTYF
jgi:putative glycosyltransferase (TIGR04372 family)